jgi:hypothetical protein
MARSCKKCGCSKCARKFKYKNNPDMGKPPLDKEIQNIMKRGFTMLQSFAKSVASRGLTNKKADIAVKQLRVLSCFGDESIGGKIEKCEHLRASETPGKYYCGGCGCGDKSRTWLTSNNNTYSKLDYPKLNCPLNMPGFSNYDTATVRDTRKFDIERYNVDDLVNITVSSPEPPEKKEDE